MRKLVVGSSRRLVVRARSVQIEKVQVPLDHHVQLPKRVPGASPEKALKRKQTISANTLRLDGSALGIDASRAVHMRYREDLCVQMRVADLSCACTKTGTQYKKQKQNAFTNASSLRLCAPEAIFPRSWSSSVSSSSSSELVARRQVNPSPTASTSNLVSVFC